VHFKGLHPDVSSEHEHVGGHPATSGALK
jgi:hypothetical protein